MTLQQNQHQETDDSGVRHDRTVKQTINLRAIVGHVAVSAGDVVAWYLLDPRTISFRSDRDVEYDIWTGGSALSHLVGHTVFGRVTARPYAVATMAERTWEDASHAADPLPGADQLLIRTQRQLRHSDLSEKYAFIGVRVKKGRAHKTDPRREVAALRDRIDKVTAIVARHGLQGRPATADDMDLLLRRSIGLGLPAPRTDRYTGDLDSADLPSITSEVEVTAEPWQKWVTVTGCTPSGDRISRKVAVLTMGRTHEMDVPQDGRGGWIQRTDRLPFPVEWMYTLEVLADERVQGQLRRQIDKISDQFRHYVDEHHKPAPRALERQNAMALSTEEELAQGAEGLATRTDGWYRIAIWGQSEQQLKERVAAVQSLYGRKVDWWWSYGQLALVREFIPGELIASRAARRRMPVASVIAALPAVTASIGDPFGLVLGTTEGISCRPVVWHPWLPMEQRHESGLMIITGGLGSGKTFAAGAIVYLSCMLGARWDVFDPSGRLGRLCRVPELKPYAREVDLMSGKPGMLSPYRVVAEPQREHFTEHDDDQANENDFTAACDQARKTRQSLCRDTLQAILPSYLRNQEQAAAVLGRAVRRVGGAVTDSASEVLGFLSTMADGNSDPDLTPEYRIAARNVAEELAEFASSARGQLIFGNYVEEEGQRPDVRLTVYKMNGLRVPKAQDARGESTDQREALALFRLGAWLTQRRIYEGDPDERKGLFIDEAHLLSFDAGLDLMDKSSVDSRKHNLRAIFASQNVSHFDVEALAPLVGAVLIGRTTADHAAIDALKLGGAPTDPAYIELLAGLSQPKNRREAMTSAEHAASTEDVEPHEFLFSVAGNSERMVLDMRAHPQLVDALKTDPGAGRRDRPAPGTDEGAKS